MDSIAFGLGLAKTVREAIDARLDPLNQKMNKLSLGLAKIGNIKALEQKVEKQQALLDAQAKRLEHLEAVGRECELMLARDAGFPTAHRSTAMQ